MTNKPKQNLKLAPVNPLEPYLGYHLRRVSAASMASFALSLVDLDIRPSDATVILFVQATPGVRQSLIGKHLGIRSANMAPLIAVLEEKGLCQKIPLDGRSSGIELTKSGIKCAAKIKIKISENEERCFAQIDDDVREQLLKTLSSLNIDWVKPQ
ncbi:MAG: MarR family transcriptional regulator [SAR86 cluster bacterium]|uniref:MarR family transcriptional regulator n=1 Tax=SAR86 cluster bacterium TaxID=2030880 RepID=A0A2A5C8W2_9GAMM|nr:MAG: MarR family transcriptional regulator [SAR86 cluster bacterium]